MVDFVIIGGCSKFRNHKYLAFPTLKQQKCERTNERTSLLDYAQQQQQFQNEAF